MYLVVVYVHKFSFLKLVYLNFSEPEYELLEDDEPQLCGYLQHDKPALFNSTIRIDTVDNYTTGMYVSCVVNKINYAVVSKISMVVLLVSRN